MHILPGSGRASPVFKFPSVAAGMKSKTESEKDGDGDKGQRRGQKRDKAQPAEVVCFYFYLAAPPTPATPQFLLTTDSSSCLKTKQSKTKPKSQLVYKPGMRWGAHEHFLGRLAGAHRACAVPGSRRKGEILQDFSLGVGAGVGGGDQMLVRPPATYS